MALVAGYLIYGKFIEKIFGPEPDRPTPALSKTDNVDFIPMPTWKVFMIQFLNIAGTGPIFGAVMGAKFGTSSYLWIVFGCIFAGAVHDYMSGMLSCRSGGKSLPNMTGYFLGKWAKHLMLVFSLILLLMVGAVFVYSPALILGDIAGNGSFTAMMVWVTIIFLYYVIATMVPIDKLIGRIYPLFAISLIFMAVALMICLIGKWPSIPEIWQGLGNKGPEIGMKGQSIFPCLFITIACGAISGFHSTQSPLMARCIKNETLGRPVFYGAMITEGIVALIWAAIGSYFFFAGGAEEVGSTITAAAPTVVTAVSKSWLGTLGGVLALLGVVAAPITSGDTALRSARLIVADFLKFDQSKIYRRLLVAVPLFAISGVMLWYNIADENGFNTIWRYFGWANQTLGAIVLWTITSYLYRQRSKWTFLITEIPAMFMTVVVVCYICQDSHSFGMGILPSTIIGLAAAVSVSVLFHTRTPRQRPIHL